MQEFLSKFTNEQARQFGEYYSQVNNVKMVAAHFNIGYRDALHYLNKFGYRKVTRKQSNVKNSCTNQTFFDVIDTHDKAYYLGFMASDGYVCKNIYNFSVGLALQLQDKYIIDKLRQYIAPEKKVTIYKNSAKICVISNHMYNTLGKYGIHEEKSHKELHFPNIPKEFEADFIRGYFDGDGCITIKATGYSVVSIIAPSRIFLEELQTKLSEYNIPTRPIMTSIREDLNPIYTLYISRREGQIAFKNFIYNNAETYLQRKYDKFTKIPC